MRASGQRPQRTANRPTDRGPERTESPELASLRAGLGNRDFGRYARALRRKPKSVTVYLAGPPPPVHAAERATPENRRLAALIDELEKLKDAELRQRREVEVAGTISPSGSDREGHELALEAIEFLARRRGLGPLQENWNFPARDNPTQRRLNVRVLIEKGVRETGSFAKALAAMSESREIAGDIEFFKAEAERFRREFRGQAWLSAQRMLDGSLEAIDGVLASYGIPPDSARRAAVRVAGGADAGAEAATVVKAAALSSEVDEAGRVRHRYRLAQWTERLKQAQERVAQAHVKANKADLERPISGTGPKWEAADKAGAELAAAQGELQALWIKAERLHPVLAAYRRGGDIEKVELGEAGASDVERQMRAVVAELLPKIADIGKAKAQVLKPGARYPPVSIPSVVAFTRANMFIPRGSIRDGIVNDLVDDAADGESWLIKIGAIALALVTLLPSGGTSIALVGIAGASLAAYDAAKAYGEYTKQKTFANTDLDIARSLSSEEPSLTRFAVSLVSLGIEAIPLIGAFNKARRIKALVNAGDEAGAAALARELNAFGKPHGAPDLGEQALRDVRAEQREAKAAGEAETGAGAAKGGGTATKATRLGHPVGAPHTTVQSLRQGIQKGMARLTGKGATNLNEEWLWLKQIIRGNPKAVAGNQELLAQIDKVYAAVRSPQFIEQEMVRVWQFAADEGISTEQALVRLAGDGRPLPVIKSDVLDYEPFRAYIRNDLPFLDNAFAGDHHGVYSHVFQELVVARALGSRAAAQRFRHLVADATGPERLLSTGKRQPFWSQVWDAIFDVSDVTHLNSPEGLGPILHEHLGLPGRLRT